VENIALELVINYFVVKINRNYNMLLNSFAPSVTWKEKVKIEKISERETILKN